MRLPRGLRKWPLLWALSCTLAVFGAEVLPIWPLHSWPGPGGLWLGRGRAAGHGSEPPATNRRCRNFRNRNAGQVGTSGSHLPRNSWLIINKLKRQFYEAEPSHFGTKTPQKYNYHSHNLLIINRSQLPQLFKRIKQKSVAAASATSSG